MDDRVTVTPPRTGAAAPRGLVSRRRATLAVALATLIAVPIVASQAQAPACNVKGAIALVNSRWESISRPTFPAGPVGTPVGMTAYAVQPSNPDVIYVTNGKAVMRSSDAGCHWDEVLELRPEGGGDVGLSSATATITAITIPERGAKRRVLLSVVEVEQGVGRPHIVRSETGDNGSFDLADQGLPPVGRPTDLRIAPRDDRMVLLALRAVPSLNDTPLGPVPPVSGAPTQSGPVGALYRSSDGGRTWAVAAEGSELGDAAVIDDIAISDTAAEDVWIIADGVLLSSRDGGASFSDRGLAIADQDAQGYRFTTLDVFQKRIYAFSRTTNAGRPAALRSNDNGASYRAVTVPFVAESAAHGARIDEVLVGTPVADGSSDMYTLSAGRWVSVAPANNLTPWRVQIDRVRSIRFGLSPEKLYRTTADRTKPKPGAPPTRVNDDLDGLQTVKPATLLPRSQTVALEVGQTKEITYTLSLPKRPTPLDVYILLDNSSSMTAFIDDLRDNLAVAINSLRAQSVDVYVGLGYYTTISDPVNPMYDRLVDIGPVTKAFFDALESLDPKSTKGNQEPILDALFQSATGAGRNDFEFQALSACDINPALPTCGIPRNKQANYRRDSLRVLLHAGNEEWNRDLPGSPSFADTAAALREKNIKHVGLAVLPLARKDMGDMARATGAVAGAGGVDCTGDGVAELAAGAGLVCSGTGNLAKTLVQILNAVSDIQDLRFYTRTKSPVLQSLQPQKILPVNVKADSTVLLRAVVSCRGVEAGSYEVQFGAALKEATIAEASALVTCGIPPAAAALIPPVVPPQQQPAPAQPPVPAPPVPAPAPQINPAPQVQPQIQAQVNAGTAYEEQEQVQIATVGLDVRREEEEEFAMSSLPPREREDPVGAAAVVLAGGAPMGSACMGVVLARRHRTALAVSTVTDR